MTHAKTSTIPTTRSWGVYGGNTDMWGTNWTVADINSSGFGAAYYVYCNTTCIGDTLSVFAASITVYYGKVFIRLHSK
jgi:hypothetical protein